VNSQERELKSIVHNLTKGGADFCIEAAGQVETIEHAFELIRNGGKLLFASHPRSGDQIRLSPHDLICGKQIAGSWGGQVLPDRDVPILHTLFSDMSKPLESLLTKRYALHEINSALEDIEAGRVFRPLIDMSLK
jgi:S-(hydroxymethyl)glutathione dehydrogenase/alcohol dehydrogenase